MSRLVLVLGDQLSPGLSALRAADKARDIVVMAEVMEEATYVSHHRQKIVLVLAAMRKFAKRLRAEGWTVAYTTLDDARNTGSIGGELLRRAAERGAAERGAAERGATAVLATAPGEWRLRALLNDLPLPVTQLPDDRFLCGEDAFAAWAEGRKALRMEYFYREMRRKTGLLMEGAEPAGGKWNYDAENRKPATADLFLPDPYTAPEDPITEAVLALVEARFPDGVGRLRPFRFATDEAGAQAAADRFFAQALPRYGDFQDAMLTGQRFLYHAVLSPYINLGLLDPIALCRRAEAEWRAGRAPLNAVEGFVRQIIGWREFIRGIYFLAGPGYTARNALAAERPLPAFYWTGETKMHCMAQAIGQTMDEAYAHHIQRLMVTGNFALLAGISPQALHEWYLAVYADAYEWVEAPNTIGMSQFADGGMVASKPYAASGAYIDRMSDYCRHCAYDVKRKSGDGACPLNPLYWDFLMRHRDRFAGNPRMAQMYRSWDRMAPERQLASRASATAILAQLDRGEPV